MPEVHKEETIYQMAFLVDDLDVAALYWGGRGAGPFYRFDDFEFSEIRHPAGAATPTISILLGYHGDVMLELIKVKNDPTGLFTGSSAPAAHHVAVLVNDVDEYIERRGLADTLAMQGCFPTGTPFAMLDTRPDTGLYTELVTLDDAVRGMIMQMRADAENFDGENLQRSFG